MRRLEDLQVFDFSLRQVVDDLVTRSLFEDSNPFLVVQPLEPRLAELDRCLVAASEIQELQVIADDVSHLSVVACRRLDSGASGEFYALQNVPSLAGAFPSIAAVSVDGAAKSPRKEGAIAVLLHELAHEAFPNHDMWFATLQNWHLLQCGFGPSTFLDDVRDERRFVSIGDHRGAAGAAVISVGMAMLLMKASLSREGVIKTLQTLKDEFANVSLGEEAVSLRDRLQDIIAT